MFMFFFRRLQIMLLMLPKILSMTEVGLRCVNANLSPILWILCYKNMICKCEQCLTTYTLILSACHILECPEGLAQEVINTIGQAFEKRFRQFLSSPPSHTVAKERSVHSRRLSLWFLGSVLIISPLWHHAQTQLKWVSSVKPSPPLPSPAAPPNPPLAHTTQHHTHPPSTSTALHWPKWKTCSTDYDEWPCGREQSIISFSMALLRWIICVLMYQEVHCNILYGLDAQLNVFVWATLTKGYCTLVCNLYIMCNTLCKQLNVILTM